MKPPGIVQTSVVFGHFQKERASFVKVDLGTDFPAQDCSVKRNEALKILKQITHLVRIKRVTKIATISKHLLFMHNILQCP